MLDVGACLDKFVSSSPSATDLGAEWQTGFTGHQVDGRPQGLARAVFRFTLDGDYPEASIEAMAKVTGDVATGSIIGPDCAGNGGGDNGGGSARSVCR